MIYLFVNWSIITMLCQFLLYNDMNQLYVRIQICVHSQRDGSHACIHMLDFPPVSFPAPWIWARYASWFDQLNSEEVIMYNFWAYTLRVFEDPIFTFLGSSHSKNKLGVETMWKDPASIASHSSHSIWGTRRASESIQPCWMPSSEWPQLTPYGAELPAAPSQNTEVLETINHC